jgi:hypothetical protein
MNHAVLKPDKHLAGVKALLGEARRQLHTISGDEALMTETPLEVQSALASAAGSLDAAVRRLTSHRLPQSGRRPAPGRPHPPARAIPGLHP